MTKRAATMPAADRLTKGKEAKSAKAEAKEGAFKRIPPAAIAASTTNPRKYFDPAKMEELVASVRAKGVVEPIVVRPHPKPKGGITHELVAGERRWRAAKTAGVKAIPAMVYDYDDVEALEVQVIENDQRSDVTDIERAAGYKALLDKGKSIEELAKRLGRSVSTIRSILVLGRLPERLALALEKQEVSRSVAELVCRIPSSDLRDKAARCVLTGTRDPSWLINGSSRGTPLGFVETKQLVDQHFTRELKGAPFSQSAMMHSGPCDTCMHKAGNNRASYPDGRADQCMDPSCFEVKCREQRKETELDAKRKSLNVLPADAATRLFGGYQRTLGWHSEWVEVDEECRDSSKRGTWRELLKKAWDQVGPTLTLAHDNRHFPHWLLKRETAIRHLRSLGLGNGQTEKDVKPVARHEVTEHAVRNHARCLAGRQLVDAALPAAKALQGLAGSSTSAETAREALEIAALFALAALYADEGLDEVMRERVTYQYPPDDFDSREMAMADWIKTAAPEALLGFILHATIVGATGLSDVLQESMLLKHLQERVTDFGELDWDELRKEACEELKAKAKQKR